MDRSLLALIIVIASVAVFSIPVFRRSSNRDKVRGGNVAQAFHFIAIAAYVGVVPAFLCGSILAGPSAFGLPVGLSLLAIAFLSLFAYAIAERPTRTGGIAEDHGWTEEDARKSGL